MDTKIEAFLKEYEALCRKHMMFVDIDPFCTLTITEVQSIVPLNTYIQDLEDNVT